LPTQAEHALKKLPTQAECAINFNIFKNPKKPLRVKILKNHYRSKQMSSNVNKKLEIFALVKKKKILRTLSGRKHKIFVKETPERPP
jgi:hypothetical protein